MPLRLAARHWMLVILPVVTLGAAAAVAIASMRHMANEVNAIEARLTERSVGAAMSSLLRRTGLTHGEYAVWDDAVRHLYSSPDPIFVEENLAASTAAATFFDTAYLVDDAGRMILGLHDGEPIASAPDMAFGKTFHILRRQATKDAPSYSVATGLLQSVWGMQAVAIGPVVPNTDQVEQPDQLRYLVIARTIDDAVIGRISEDYVIKGLHLARPPATTGMPLSDPAGNVIAWLHGNRHRPARRSWKPSTPASS